MAQTVLVVTYKGLYQRSGVELAKDKLCPAGQSKLHAPTESSSAPSIHSRLFTSMDITLAVLGAMLDDTRQYF